jgi:hypothetical protein
MPLRTKNKSRTSRSRSKSIKSKSRSKSIKSRSKSYRKYRGGCDSCNRGSGASSANIWTSSGDMHGGASPEQLSNDKFSLVTDKVFYSAA